jgi:NAD(P)H-dependent FMN reductase
MAINPRQMLGLGGTRPSMQYEQLNQTYQSDPRRILGQALMGQGTSTAPVRTPLAGLGRLSSALVGAYLQRKAGDELSARETKMTDAILGGLPEALQNNPLIRANLPAVSGAATAALLQPQTSQSIVDDGDLAYVQTNTQSPFSTTPTSSIGGLVQRRAPTDARTSAMKNAEAQGLVPGSPEYNAFIAKSGSGVTINTGDKKGGEATVSTITDLAKTATSARQTLARVDQMTGLLDSGVATGFGQETITGLKRVGQFFNPEYKVKEVAGAEAFIGNANAMIGPLVKLLGSNPTDNDLKFFVTASPTLGKSVEGNRLLLKGIKLSNARDVALSNAAQEFVQRPENENIGSEGLKGFAKLQKHLTEVATSSPLFTQAGQALIDEFTQLTGSPPPVPSSGSVFDQLINQGLVAQ